MKKKNGSFSKLIIYLEIFQYATILIIAYIVIWGLIIEPHLPQHYYGITDLIELTEAVLLLIPIRLINLSIGFFRTVQYFDSGLNIRFIPAIKCIRMLGKKYKFSKKVVFNESFIHSVESKHCIYMITGLTTSIKPNKAYCYGWSFNENEKDIDLYQIIYSKDKPVYHRFTTVPVGSKCYFNMEYRDRIMIKWKMYIKKDHELKLIYVDDIVTHDQSHWGINLDYFINTTPKGKIK